METSMTKLTDTQLAILTAAAERPDRNLLPLPGSLRGGAALKVVGALLTRGLVAETVTDTMTQADPALNRFSRNEADGRAVLLHLTEAGLFAAQGAHGAAAGAVQARVGTEDGNAPNDAPAAASGADTAPAPRTPREGTKQATLIAMLRSDSGATIDEIAAATGWQAHTVRGAFAGALKKRLGLEVTSEKVEGRGRVYRLPQV
jgi:DNA-binding MarR family transcriptional regulator